MIGLVFYRRSGLIFVVETIPLHVLVLFTVLELSKLSMIRMEGAGGN